VDVTPHEPAVRTGITLTTLAQIEGGYTNPGCQPLGCIAKGSGYAARDLASL